jgi:uncharacterized ferritin-like protein (DUF455 family)
MPKLSATALKTRIEQLQKQLAAAEASKAPAIAKVRALMKKLGVTTDDLVGHQGLWQARPTTEADERHGRRDPRQPRARGASHAARSP